MTKATERCVRVGTGAHIALMHQYYVYMLASHSRVLYIGVTSDLAARIWMHREGRGSKFCARYGLKRLVYAEQVPTIEEAIAREKAMKKWYRAWKIELIERLNPDWDDLWDQINS